jgi:hypothetical protein
MCNLYSMTKNVDAIRRLFKVDPANDRTGNVDIARGNPPFGVFPDEAAAAVEDVLGSIGDTCPECPPEE